ncbi:MAG TPA: serine hydrolase domain-containing protein [Hyphomonadaceae bacterium]|jgi:CubicO group peptidase (beta-lactamase class C family)|nr:serine hydrolase domain-containing protein [Hyphomonadaceae bacterium]
MGAIELVDPAEAGLNAERLKRIPGYFQGYIDSQRLPCCAALVARGGQVAHLSFQGATEMGGKTPINEDTIYRIYSMTKPITSVAAMMLFEEGLLRLDHEVSRYIPEFGDVQVFAGGTAEAPKLEKPNRPIMVRDLFLHTSGITYSFLQQGPADAIYRARGIEHPKWQGDLKSFCEAIAQAPLAFSPGDRWNYSNATDVLGRVVEVASGMSLDQFFRKRIFGPLGMNDTGFHVPESEIGRLMALYARNPANGVITKADPAGAASVYARPPNVLSGGGGLASTIGDYFKFCLMLANGGELNGVRILSPKTLEFMTRNHLPGNKTLRDMGDKTFSETRMDGTGFGLGWSVVTDVIATTQPGSEGTFSWGGMASTFFWIDPVEDIIAIQMTQLMPSGAYPIRPQLQQLVYAAIEE